MAKYDLLKPSVSYKLLDYFTALWYVTLILDLTRSFILGQHLSSQWLNACIIFFLFIVAFPNSRYVKSECCLGEGVYLWFLPNILNWTIFDSDGMHILPFWDAPYQHMKRS